MIYARIMNMGRRGNVWSATPDEASKIDERPILDITQRQRLPASTKTAPRGCEHGPHEAYTLPVLPASVSSVHRESFDHIHSP
jgi:hypothetical protein